ncbi:hypothetical protein [Paraburkholderia sacchari]|uniref:hypothetical protein n=1 Tax=Paraburkholderia sacchari TaxID=159450 RepID=UPI003CC8337E
MKPPAFTGGFLFLATIGAALKPARKKGEGFPRHTTSCSPRVHAETGGGLMVVVFQLAIAMGSSVGGTAVRPQRVSIHLRGERGTAADRGGAHAPGVASGRRAFRLNASV